MSFTIKPRTRDDSGFTLVELLVVVIIIGILAAIAIPVFLNQRQVAWKASVASDLRNIAESVEAVGTINNGTYPDSVAGTYTTASTSPWKTSTGNSLTVAVKGGGTSFTIVGVSSNVPGGEKYDSVGGGMSAWAPTVPAN